MHGRNPPQYAVALENPARLLELVTANHHLAVEDLQKAIVAKLLSYSGSEQEDDITLLIARGR